jgi:hypothetical protein
MGVSSGCILRPDGEVKRLLLRDSLREVGRLFSPTFSMGKPEEKNAISAWTCVQHNLLMRF